MKFQIIFTLANIVMARPRRHAYRAAIVEKGRADQAVGHEFIDVAWLFANHRNQLPTIQAVPKRTLPLPIYRPHKPTGYGSKSRAKYSTRGYGYKRHNRQNPTTDDEEIMSQLFNSNLISRSQTRNRSRSRSQIQARRFQTRYRSRAAARVLRTYKHILTNLPSGTSTSGNESWEGSGELW